MNIILIITVIGSILGALIMFNLDRSLLENFLRILWGIVCGFFVGILIGSILSAIIGFGIKVNHPEWVKVTVTDTIELVNIQDNSTVSGSFFLGFGSLNGEMCYSYYEKVGDNEFKLSKLSANVANIKYITDAELSEGQIPRIEKIDSELISDWGIWFNSRYYIYVPNGSIKNTFTLDAQ